MPRKLPKRLRPLFWEYDFGRLSVERHQHLIIGRILSRGGWEDLKWLRKRLGDDALRAWIIDRRGADLSRKQVRFWETMLALPAKEATNIDEREIWDRRTGR
jgi:hypothetical protein